MPDNNKNPNLVSEEEIEKQFSAGNWAPANAEPVAPGQPIAGGAPIPSNTPGGQYGSGPLPPNFGLEPALTETRYPPSTGSIYLMPIQGGAGDNSKAIGVATQVVKEALAALPAAVPVTQVSDGITHGQNNVTKGTWESDPAYVIFRDDFHGALNIGPNAIGGTPPNSGIGQLGWTLVGVPGGDGGNYGGAAPYIGQYAWDNNGTPSDFAFLIFGQSGSETNGAHSQQCWALAENPGWQMTWVFKVDADVGTVAFSSAKKAIYVGLGGPTARAGVNEPNSRPDIFIGVRYDTSMSSPSINDSFFTFEVVANPTYTGLVRNNTQGTTFVTTVAPVAGVWHRLDIYSTIAGRVTLTLDGVATMTTNIPVFTFTTPANGLTGSLTNNIGTISWTPFTSTPPESVWTNGSIIAVSGFTGAQGPLNGTWTANYTKAGSFLFNSNQANIASGNAAGTVSGYPALTPIAWMGNDDTASPTAFNMMFFVDFFSFVWNPNLGPSAPGTPSAVLPRYF